MLRCGLASVVSHQVSAANPSSAGGTSEEVIIVMAHVNSSDYFCSVDEAPDRRSSSSNCSQ